MPPLCAPEQDESSRLEMESREGVFAMLLRSEDRKRVDISSQKTLIVRPGWYVYVGGAYGKGCLSGELADICSAGNQSHDITALLPHLSIQEIWYTYDVATREHEWAQVLPQMRDAQISLVDFGASDCHGGCDAHLLFFPTQPSLPLFRRMLIGDRANEIFVDFVVKPVCSTKNAESQERSFSQKYANGRFFLEQRRKLALKGDKDTTPLCAQKRLHLTSGDKRASRLAYEVANHVGISHGKLLHDARLAEAVDAIVTNCGQLAYDVLFDENRSQKPESIFKLRDTADTRQAFCLEQVACGRRQSVRPTKNDPVFDTVSFGQVESRLRDAAKRLREWDMVCRNADESVVDEGCRVIKSCLKASHILQKLISNPGRGPSVVPENLSREGIREFFGSLRSRGYVIGQVKGVLERIVQNIWDFDEMRRRGIIATPKQRARSLRHVESILESATRLLGSYR